MFLGNWCTTQVESCPVICAQTNDGKAKENECDAVRRTALGVTTVSNNDWQDSLSYGCICSDDTEPNLTAFTLTIPFYKCQEWGNQCVNACPPHDSECQSSCRQDHPCGAQDPYKPNTTSTTVGPTASQTDPKTKIYTNPPGVTGTNDPEDGAAMLALGRSYGLAIMAGSMLIGFAML